MKTYDLIWNLMFLTITTLITITLIIGESDKKKRQIIYGVILITIITTVTIINYYKIFNIITLTKIMGKINYLYEIFCWLIIMVSAFSKLEFNQKIQISKTEKILAGISIIIGILSIITLIISNINYVVPKNENVLINNYYFNADINRGISEIITTSNSINTVHPLYRFITLTIMFPITIISKILQTNISVYTMQAINGYIVCFLQVIINAISTIIMYKLLKREGVRNKTAIIGTILFTISLGTIWTSIFPETYAITTLTLLSFIYLYRKRNIWAVALAVITIGSNLMSAVPVGIIILIELQKNIKLIKEYIKKHKTLSIIALIVLTTIMVIVINYFGEYIIKWANGSEKIFKKLASSINYFIIPLLLGPNFTQNVVYFIQKSEFEIHSLIIFIIFSVIATLGYAANRKKEIPNICIIYIFIAYILHVVIGYGLTNGIIYSPLYTWAFIVLISLGVEYIFTKVKKEKTITIVSCILILFVAIHNFNWLNKLGSYLKKEEFKEKPSAQNSNYQYIKNDEYNESFFCSNAIYRVRDGKKIINNLDVVQNKNNVIVGLIKDSSWFKIYYENNKLKLNVLDNIQEIKEEEFYIFGMGLREKFILTSGGNEKYRLIKYSNKEEIINNLTLERIDYENYTVYLNDKNNNKIKIYEDNKGIYIQDNNETKILDDSITINIPNFDEYEHKEQLKVLFNEIMVNITKQGPKPNFIAYKNTWYRDAAIVAMALKETNNLNQIMEWLNNIDKIYDEQNGEKEADNLGQVLYLISLAENKNQKIIEQVLEEAEKIKTSDGYINGKTDGEYHPIYQTKWLIYGMKKLGLDYSEYKVPDIKDSYKGLIWFDNEEDDKNIEINDRWQYLYFANLHYNKTEIEYKNTKYPISNEILPSKANTNNMDILNNNFVQAKIITPHSWAASEMFLYLIDLDREKI